MARKQHINDRPFIGLDGEGLGRRPHRYVMLCAADEQGNRWDVSSGRRRQLSTVECLDFILDLPKRRRIFAFSFTYDLAKILEDLPDEPLWRLFHPEARQGERGRPRAVLWNGYRLNLVSTKFTVQRGKQTATVFDIWKFFQSSFVKALERWDVRTTKQLQAMQRMKDARGEFAKLTLREIREYCFDECEALCELARRLVTAHDDAGYRLKSFFGAGSTASVVLDSLHVKELKADPPPRMQEAVASSFFGGRFENCRIGPVAGPVYSYDISSAYPYQLTRLPCLLHGTWKHTKRRDRIEGYDPANPRSNIRAVLVRYIKRDGACGDSWASLPFRQADGTIVYPRQSGGGWVWADEFFAAEALDDGAEFREAYYLQQSCKCGSPFAAIPELYRRRVALGKDSAGLVLKLGMNSCYGKLAQSIGQAPPFQCWIWASLITSGCRAQMLQALYCALDPASVLMIATDGLYSTERLQLPTPLDTGTDDLPKPLGGWEETVLPEGVFCARPGVYFPLAPTDEQLDKVRARGIGKAKLLQQWPTLVTAWERGDSSAVLADIDRFCGVLTSLHRSPSTGTISRSEHYGQWVKRRIELSFDPAPKRGPALPSGALPLLSLDPHEQSAPYDAALISPEAQELIAQQIVDAEQPDVPWD